MSIETKKEKKKTLSILAEKNDVSPYLGEFIKGYKEYKEEIAKKRKKEKRY